MLAAMARRAIRVALPRIPRGLEVAEQVALNALGFTPETVIKAYLNGYFPVPDSRGCVHWQAPAQRCVIPIDAYKVPRNLARLIRQGTFEISVDRAFREVIQACAEREQTWINTEVIRVYSELHAMGIAHSVEAWQDGVLVGGLYGIALGRVFATESQFHRVRDAGKVAFVHTFQILKQQGFRLHDVQFQTDFLAQFGSIEIPHHQYRLQLLREVVQRADFTLQPPK